jgi:hypothetical protein
MSKITKIYLLQNFSHIIFHLYTQNIFDIRDKQKIEIESHFQY